MLDRAKLSLTGRYGIATGGAVTDPVLLSVATDFDHQVMRKIAGISPVDLKAGCTDRSDVLVTTKYDGEGVFVWFEQGSEAFAFWPAGRVRLGFPALDELSQKLSAHGVKKALLRCELCLAHSDGPREGVAEVIRASFSGDAAQIARLRLVGLDVVMLDGRDMRAQQAQFKETFDLLGRLLGVDEQALCQQMHGQIVPERDAPALFEKLLARGAEGIVLRRLNRAEAWKVKPHKSVDAVVLGFIEGEFEGQYGVTSLLTGLSYPVESGAAYLQTFVRVGSGLSDVERIAMLARTFANMPPIEGSRALANDRFFRPCCAVCAAQADCRNPRRGPALK